jgi:metallophosphoesterase (TIGR00282 family)
LKILFIGDIVGKSGRKAIKYLLANIIDKSNIDIVIANGENAAGGFGITKIVSQELFDSGINVITTGNHVWNKKETQTLISAEKKILRPANYPDNVPGCGSGISNTPLGEKIGVINISGRVFMDPLDCPFRVVQKEISLIEKETKNIIVDFHAEATSEKMAMGWFLDGKVSAVVGTHTHVQTADERILPGGTGYITDVGMTGSFDSIIGIKKDNPIKKFLTQMPQKFEVAKKDIRFQGVIVEIDSNNGKCITISRITKKLNGEG